MVMFSVIACLGFTYSSDVSRVQNLI